MNKITIFTGKPNTGKTKKSIQIALEKNAVWLFRNRPNNYNLKNVDEHTQILIFDDIAPSDIPHITEIANKDFIIFRPPYHREPIMIKRPEMLICTNIDPDAILKDVDEHVPFNVFRFAK